MKPRQENHQTVNINDVPEEVWHENAAADLPTKYLKAELQRRGYIIQDNTEYDEATGLMKWKGYGGDYYFDPETRKMVSEAEAYKRASGGW